MPKPTNASSPGSPSHVVLVQQKYVSGRTAGSKGKRRNSILNGKPPVFEAIAEASFSHLYGLPSYTAAAGYEAGSSVSQSGSTCSTQSPGATNRQSLIDNADRSPLNAVPTGNNPKDLNIGRPQPLSIKTPTGIKSLIFRASESFRKWKAFKSVTPNPGAQKIIDKPSNGSDAVIQKKVASQSTLPQQLRPPINNGKNSIESHQQPAPDQSITCHSSCSGLPPPNNGPVDVLFSNAVADHHKTLNRPKSISHLPTSPIEPTASPPCVSRETSEKEGPIFNTTILESSTKSGKNGIPDVVILCIEHLNYLLTLKTPLKDLYEAPGSIERVRELVRKFQETVPSSMSRNSSVATSSIHQKSNSSSNNNSNNNSRRSSFDSNHSSGDSQQLGKPNSERPRRKSMLDNVIQIDAGNVIQIDAGDWSELSIAAINGSNPELKRNQLASQKVTRPITRGPNSVISLAFEESKRGVGLWDGEGLAGTAGFVFSLDKENPLTIASLLKRFLSTIKGGFGSDELWAELGLITKKGLSLSLNLTFCI
ncbi:hypothetical protein BDR26DRAFT_856843 [Obelidium mucronatum]|nr:hypothetical protein BDR26DRAFT_856843 [Obelidium mucronatum]